MLSSLEKGKERGRERFAQEEVGDTQIRGNNTNARSLKSRAYRTHKIQRKMIQNNIPIQTKSFILKNNGRTAWPRTGKVMTVND